MATKGKKGGGNAKPPPEKKKDTIVAPASKEKPKKKKSHSGAFVLAAVITGFAWMTQHMSCSSVANPFSRSWKDVGGVTHYKGSPTVPLPDEDRWDVALEPGKRVTSFHEDMKAGSRTPYLLGHYGKYSVSWSCRDCATSEEAKEAAYWDCDPPMPRDVCMRSPSQNGKRLVATMNRKLSVSIKRLE